MNQNGQPCPLNDADCERCIRIISQTHPQSAAELDRLARAGFDLQALKNDNDANLASARGLMREYFPTRAPGPIG